MLFYKEDLDQAVRFHTPLDVSDNFCEISEDMASAKEDLDLAIPSHTLLDVSGIPSLCLMINMFLFEKGH